MSESANPSAEPLIPATFEMLVMSLATQAQVHLGLFRLTEEPPEINLPGARHAIDLLAMLLEKTKGNLTLEEKRLVENSVTELRFRYVQVAGSGASA